MADTTPVKLSYDTKIWERYFIEVEVPNTLTTVEEKRAFIKEAIDNNEYRDCGTRFIDGAGDEHLINYPDELGGPD